jgi:hypothetical protein
MIGPALRLGLEEFVPNARLDVGVEADEVNRGLRLDGLMKPISFFQAFLPWSRKIVNNAVI